MKRNEEYTIITAAKTVLVADTQAGAELWCETAAATERIPLYIVCEARV